MLSSPASSDGRKPAMLPYSTPRSLALLALLLLAGPLRATEYTDQVVGDGDATP